jgi:hypothetical protein
MFGINCWKDAMVELTGSGAFVRVPVWVCCPYVFFDPQPGEVMPPHIVLALVLCFVFPGLVLGVDILMDPHGNGSLSCKFRPSQFRYC